MHFRLTICVSALQILFYIPLHYWICSTLFHQQLDPKKMSHCLQTFTNKFRCCTPNTHLLSTHQWEPGLSAQLQDTSEFPRPLCHTHMLSWRATVAQGHSDLDSRACRPGGRQGRWGWPPAAERRSEPPESTRCMALPAMEIPPASRPDHEQRKWCQRQCPLVSCRLNPCR